LSRAGASSTMVKLMGMPRESGRLDRHDQYAMVAQR
jgi:hypothetical protein